MLLMRAKINGAPFRRLNFQPIRTKGSRRYQSTGSILNNNEFFKVSDEVREAIHAKQPVVALETTIYTHGFPYPDNIALASHLESVVRLNGGVPATIGILNGVAYVGMTPEQIIQLTSGAGLDTTVKISRRDLGFVCGLGQGGRKINGGTTIAGTMVLANLAGIKVFATGGLGGVHRGGEVTMDISADLTELGRTPVTVISSGCKSFLDIPRTLEFLETQGVGVATFADGREGEVDFPAFWTRESGVKSPGVLKNEEEAAAVIHAQSLMRINSGLHFANPIPLEHSIPKADMDQVIEEAIREAEEAGKTGSANTPFILSKIKELTKGKSIPANQALIESNVRRGTRVAVELAKLELKDAGLPGDVPKYEKFQNQSPLKLSTTTSHNSTINNTSPDGITTVSKRVDIIVAGSLAVDLSCDYLSSAPTFTSPTLHTSNPASITQTLGGVGHNIATAAHFSGAAVSLYSAVGSDLSGTAILSSLSQNGMETSGVKVLGEGTEGQKTAQYVAVNDRNKDLVLAMADMRILESPEARFELWENDLHSLQEKPKWLAVDANWPAPTIMDFLCTAKSMGAKTAYEPVSMVKGVRIFYGGNNSGGKRQLGTYPNHTVDLVTPNKYELITMLTEARKREFFDRPDWWAVINSLGIPNSGAIDRYISICGKALVEEGVPQQCVQLLPFMPTVIAKLGSNGLLLTQIIEPGDKRLTDPDFAQYIVSRGPGGEEGNGIVNEVGGLYIRHFPPPQTLKDSEIVSVNGVGDTLLGVLLAGLANGAEIEEMIGIAQRAAIMTLKSKESVSPKVKLLAGELASKIS